MEMSNKELQEKAIEEAAKLNHSISSLSKDTKELASYGHRSRTLIRLLVVSFIFDLFLSVIIGVVVVKANDTAGKAQDTASQLHITQVAQSETCQASNKARATNVALWNNVFDTIGEARLPEIPELRRQVAESFAQRECPLP